MTVLLVLISSAIGVLVGVAAARHKGFSITAGVVGGLLLGIASPLLYLVSGSRKPQPLMAPTRTTTATPRQLLLYLVAIPGAIVAVIVVWALVAL